MTTPAVVRPSAQRAALEPPGWAGRTTGGMVRAAMTGDERQGRLSLTAAAIGIALWLQLATGQVF